MGKPRPGRNDRSEAKTVVAQLPVHVRRWTSQPRWAELLGALAARATRVLRLVWVRVEAVAETAAVWSATELQCLRLRLEVRMLGGRRRTAIRELGEATYAGDEKAVSGWRSSVETVDAEIARRQ